MRRLPTSPTALLATCVVAVVSSCGGLTIPPGTLACSQDRQCPNGYQCVQADAGPRCYPNGYDGAALLDGLDAATSGDAPVEAGPSEAGPEAGPSEAGPSEAGPEAGPSEAGPSEAGAAGCPQLDSPAGGSVATTVLTPGSIATYACNMGWKMTGVATRTCQGDGTWSGAAPTCALLDCGPLTSPSMGTVAAATTTFGATATYSCQMGYGPSGSSTRTCTASGTWSGTQPTCVIANCPALPNPTGGSVAAPLLTFGATATYSCDTGYLQVGSATRTCQASGAWSGTAATCTPKDCMAPGAPANGSVSAPTTTYPSTATYTCASGYTLSGAPTRACTTDGVWSGSVPACLPVDCHAPSAIANGVASAPVTTFGSTATYSCTTNYTISGTLSTRTCLATAMWSTPIPSCIDICTLGGAGTAAHCCNDSVCSGTTPSCNTTTHGCVARPTGGACTTGNQCATGFCVSGICCSSACPGIGVCNNSCSGGTCQPTAAGTACGTPIPSYQVGSPSNAHFTDVLQMCDGNGTCKAPTIACPTPAGGVSCALATNACCDMFVAVVEGNPQFAIGCGSSSGCGSTATTRGLNCQKNSDCPTGRVCCNQDDMDQFIEWNVCVPAGSCVDSGNVSSLPVCNPAAPVCPSGTCQSDGTFAVCD